MMTLSPVMAKNKKVEIRIIQTSDVHGCFFPYDFISRKEKDGTLARVSTYVNRLREEYGKNLLLLDNGDILQGQPTCYYSNYINTDMPNVAAEVVNYLKYDAETIGNHDVETGHAVYDKWMRELNCPLLGANVVDTKTGEPYFKPYTIIEREGVKIAVLGMLTPAIPNWLNEELWRGMRFEEMVSCARKWMHHLKQTEHPDIVIGLFHSGRDGGIVTDTYAEDASLDVAKEVGGFDLVLYGHDHTRHSESVTNVEGNKVLCLDPSCNAYMVADATISIVKKKGKVISKEVSGNIVNITNEAIDQRFVDRFQSTINLVKDYVGRRIGYFEQPLYTRDCYFGSAAFADFIHDLQLQLTKADISFNAPLAFDTTIDAGEVTQADMFKLYRFENLLFVLKMTGEEIRKHLEFSYDMWCNTMTSPNDHALRLNDDSKEDQQRTGFQ